MPRNKPKPPSPLFVIGFAVAFVLISLYPLSIVWKESRLRGASEPATCEILDKGVETAEDHDGTTRGHYPTLEIAHTVDGQRYTRRDVGKRFLTESDASASIKELRIGETIECLYVAGSPGEVVALEQDEGQIRGMLVFAILLWLAPLGLFLWARTRPGWRKG